MMSRSKRATAQFLTDLNVFTMFTSSLYSLVYKRADTSLYSNWTELFVAAGHSNEEGDMAKRMIGDALESLGMSEADLKQLQEIRRLRNRLAHPRVPLAVARVMAYSRWRSDPSYESIKKMFDVLRDDNRPIDPSLVDRTSEIEQMISRRAERITFDRAFWVTDTMSARDLPLLVRLDETENLKFKANGGSGEEEQDEMHRAVEEESKLDDIPVDPGSSGRR